MIFQSLPVLWQTWSFTHTWREWINCQLQERVYLSQNVTSVTWTWQSALYSDTRRLYTNWILESRFSVQNVKSYFKAGTDLSCTEQKATHWVHLTIQCFPVQNATTSQIQRRTWAFTKRGCTQQDQAYGCAWPERVKRSPDLFWTNTNTKNTNKTMPMWIAQCAINHLVQSEIWRGTWKPFIKQWRWMCLETQIIPIQTTISMSRMKSSTMLPFWWTLCFDSHSTCQHSWTICTKLVQW